MKNINKVIIMAGLGCGKGFYCNVIKELNNHFQKVEVIEIRNLEGFKEQEEEVINKLGNQTEPFIVLGHCYGGQVFSKLLGEGKYKNSNLKGLVLCNSYWSFKHLSFNTIVNNKECMGNYLGDYPFLKENEKGCFPKEYTFKLIDMVFGHYNSLNSIIKIDNAFPILMLNSENDGYFMKDDVIEMYYILNFIGKNIKYKMFDNYKHLGLLTNVENYVSEIKNFVCNL